MVWIVTVQYYEEKLGRPDFRVIKDENLDDILLHLRHIRVAGRARLTMKRVPESTNPQLSGPIGGYDLDDKRHDALWAPTYDDRWGEISNS